MERIMKLFNREYSQIAEAALVLGFFTFISQILAIFRDRFLAGNIGAGSTLDIYYAAFRIPDLIFTFGAALVSVSILMPFLKSQLEKSRMQGKEFIRDIFTVFFAGIFIIALVCWFLMPILAEYLFPGFNGEELSSTIMLSRIMLLSPILLGISNLFTTITQAFKQFFVYAIAPVFYNLGIIVGIVWLYPVFGLAGLGYGVILGAALHMLIQLPVVVRHGLMPSFSRSIDWANIKTVIGHSLPRTITLSMTKIVFLIFVSMASTLVAGTISVFNLSYNLQSVPLAIIGVSYSVAAFPTLVDYYNKQNFAEFVAHVMGPIRQIIFWSLPVISLFIILRAQIVRVILGTGNFDWSDTRLTAASLALFIVSVVAQSIVLLLIRAYYASGRTWKPLWITLVSSASTIVFAYIFVSVYNSNPGIRDFFEGLLRIQGVEGSSVVMLSLAYSVGVFLNLIILLRYFKKDFSYKGGFGIRKTFMHSFTASIIMGIVAYTMLQIIEPYIDQTSTVGILVHGFSSGLIAIIFGGLFLWVIKNEEIRIFARTIKKKLWKTLVINQERI
ncbi:MAG: putative peptidoglycan lipid II flippase [Candidatus Paceibacteria bacterium]|jgi:putative peptidoglycan lipid II flippase